MQGTGAAGSGAFDHQVVIAGGGPTGLVLGAELRLAGVDVVIVEPRADQSVDGSRAGGLHARTLEVLDQRGVVDRFLAEGQTYPFAGFAGIQLDISDFPSRHACVLGLWQRHIERILAGWVLDDLAVPIRRGRSVVGLVQDEEGVDVELSDGSTLRARHVVGCDGGRSTVRKAAGIEFPGLDAETSWMIAQVEMADAPAFGFTRDELGTHAMGRREEGEPIGVVLTEPSVGDGGLPTEDDLRALLVRIYGTDFGVHDVSSLSRFTDATRQAATYRAGRVLVAGDAAHVHPPQGGQGLNVGVQDAVNLGWKLAQVVHGTSPEVLLDSYHDERHPVGARVQENTKAQVAIAGADPRHQALRDLLGEVLVTDEARRKLVGMVSGLDVRYDLGDGHPLVGRRMPDLELAGVDGVDRAFPLLHDARPLLLDLGGGAVDAPGWEDRVKVVRAEVRGGGPWELPVVGEVEAPEAVLVRPDGHVAWAGSAGDPALADALERWFGPAAPTSST